MNKKPFVVGITGGTASGKTFVIEALKNYFESNILVISHDQYYKSSTDAMVERWERINLDEPNAFDNELLVNNLTKLLNGENVLTPVYNFAEHKQEKAMLELSPKPIIVLEGILIFQIPEIRKMLNMKIFLEASPDIRLARRLLRDIDERGINTKRLHDDIERYINIVKPMYDKYVHPSIRYANFVFNTDRGSLYAAEDITKKLKGIYKKMGIKIEDKIIKAEEYKF